MFGKRKIEEPFIIEYLDKNLFVILCIY